MLGGTVNKIINTQFKWSGAEQGMTNMQKLSVSAAAIGAAVAAAGMALWRLAEQTTEAFGAFEDMSQRTGIAASELHALSLAAEQTSSDFDAIVTGLRRMPSFLEDARNGMASATTTMDALGVSVADFEGLSPEDSFFRMVDALGTMEDETRRAALAQDVFGRGAMALIPLIEEGSGGLRDFAREARRTGMVLDDEAYAAADRFQDALARMQAQMQAALMEGIEPLLPELQAMAESIVTIASEGIPLLIQAAGELAPMLDFIAAKALRVAENMINMQTNIDWLIDQITGSDRTVQRLAAGMTIDPGLMSREEYRIALGRDRLAIEQEIADKQAEAAASLQAEADILGSGGGGRGRGGGGGDTILDAERARNELLHHRMQILEKQQNLEERQAAAVAEALQARIDEKKAMQQAEYDAQLERLQNYADLTTQIMGAAWDSAFGNARQGFSDMLKDMAADLAKSAVLGFLRKSISGASTGGLGFFF